MNIKRTLSYVIMVSMAGFSILMIIGFAVSFNQPSSDGKPPSPAADIIMLILLGILPLIVVARWYVALRSQERKNVQERHEAEALQLAVTKNGKLTVAELAMHTSLSHDESEQLLQQMAVKGLTTLYISETGVPVYHFRTLISDQEKQQAEEI